MRVFVLDKKGRPLMPCHPARARQLLDRGKAKVYRRYPFTIILTQREGGELQPMDLRFDPGSKTTGVALCAHFKRGYVLIWAVNLKHRGDYIRKRIEQRRGVRRSRRNRKTRYRAPRFDNRTRPKGWLPPSLMSRVYNVITWAKRLIAVAPITQIDVETVRFDMQRMQNPEIAGIEYQRGDLFGYEVREYLLEKWHRKCAYCGKENIPLEIEHIQAKANGGSDRVSNLTLACERCNDRKGTQDIRDFLRNDPERLAKILRQAKAPLKDAAAVNATRYAIGNALKQLGLPVNFWSGGRTKYNRTQQGYRKDHWTDAACVGERGDRIRIADDFSPILVTAAGHGNRQFCRVNRHGFPRTSAKQRAKRMHGFQTGDIVEAKVTKGKKIGRYLGRVAVRARGYFNIATSKGVVSDINYRYCRRVYRCDGYNYGRTALPPLN